MKGFPAKQQLKLKIAPISSVDYSSCDTLPCFSLSCPHDTDQVVPNSMDSYIDS